MSLGLRIKTMRRALGLTQQALADRTEVSRIYIQALESGRRTPSMKLLNKLADALGVEVQDLVKTVSSPGGRLQLEEVPQVSPEVEVWYRSKRLKPWEPKFVQSLIDAAISRWEERRQAVRRPERHGNVTRFSIPDPPEFIPDWASNAAGMGRARRFSILAGRKKRREKGSTSNLPLFLTIPGVFILSGGAGRVFLLTGGSPKDGRGSPFSTNFTTFWSTGGARPSGNGQPPPCRALSARPTFLPGLPP